MSTFNTTPKRPPKNKNLWQASIRAFHIFSPFISMVFFSKKRNLLYKDEEWKYIFVAPLLIQNYEIPWCRKCKMPCVMQICNAPSHLYLVRSKSLLKWCYIWSMYNRLHICFSKCKKYVLSNIKMIKSRFLKVGPTELGWQGSPWVEGDSTLLLLSCLLPQLFRPSTGPDKNMLWSY